LDTRKQQNRSSSCPLVKLDTQTDIIIQKCTHMFLHYHEEEKNVYPEVFNGLLKIMHPGASLVDLDGTSQLDTCFPRSFIQVLL